MSKRITLTFNDDELEAIARLRDTLMPESTIAGFAADCLIHAVQLELHGIECQCEYLTKVLDEWRPSGHPN